LVKLTDELRVEYHTLSETDLALIHQHRGAENRLGFAVQLCYMRYPGIVLPEFPCQKTVEFIAHQLSIDPELFYEYGKGINTIHKHSVELQTFFGFKQFFALAYQQHLTLLENLALQSDKGMVLAIRLVENLRAQRILLPSFLVIEQLCSEAITRANRQINQKLIASQSQFGTNVGTHRTIEKITGIATRILEIPKRTSKSLVENGSGGGTNDSSAFNGFYG
jgi:hypothetical protein